MMRRSRTFVRSLAVDQIRQKLINDSFPRAQMALIVLLTGGFGLLASFTMLQFGLGSMAVRYPLALGCAYLFFLFLIWLWLRTNASDYVDAPDITRLLPQNESAGHATEIQCVNSGTVPFDSPPLIATDTSSGETFGAIAEVDELAVPLLAAALAIGLALASLYVVYIAPVLFAEAMVDAALSYALFRYLRGHDPQHWLASTVRHTALPFIATALVVAGAGAAMSLYVPGAQSIGQVIKNAGERASEK